MVALDRQPDVLRRLQEVHRSCPEMRLGQLLATVAMLGEDSTGRSLWDIEDDELSAAVERFAGDLARRTGRLTYGTSRITAAPSRTGPCVRQ